MSLDGWKEKLFLKYLVWLCRPNRIRRHLQAELPAKARASDTVNRRRVRVAAVQQKLKLHKNPLSYVDEIHRRVQEAVDGEARLVVFPEYHNLPLLGMLPGIEKMAEGYGGNNTNGGSAKEEAGGSEISLSDVFRYMSPAVQPLVQTLFSTLASAYALHIMAGSYALANNGDVVNRSFLYGPSGRLLASQDKVHLMPVETEWGIRRGTTFSICSTELGRLALPVCMDATYYETFRIMEHKKVDIVLLPIADLAEYNYWLGLRGIWPRVQESVLYGVKSALVGEIAGLKFTGRSGIFAPIELSPQRDGILAEVDTFDREAIAFADLDLEALEQLRRDHPWRDSNHALYRKYFPTLYSS
jgi:predicted amidohydrolase